MRHINLMPQKTTVERLTPLIVLLIIVIAVGSFVLLTQWQSQIEAEAQQYEADIHSLREQVKQTQQEIEARQPEDIDSTDRWAVIEALRNERTDWKPIIELIYDNQNKHNIDIGSLSWGGGDVLQLQVQFNDLLDVTAFNEQLASSAYIHQSLLNQATLTSSRQRIELEVGLIMQLPRQYSGTVTITLQSGEEQ